jgi:hypothetical protein
MRQRLARLRPQLLPLKTRVPYLARQDEHGRRKLLQDWEHIKDEEKRDKSMMAHVHGEYPVNVESITQDPTERRLHRLLGTMSDLKLPGDSEGLPTKDEKASRTWRSIVF